MPHFLFERNEGGISNFGVHRLTIIPFSLAFLACSICLAQTAHLLKPKTSIAKQFRMILIGFSALLFLTLLSTYPYKLNQRLDEVHIWTGISLFYAELSAAVWLTLRVLKNRLGYLLFFVGSAGFVLATLTFFGLIHLLFVSQIVTAAAFGLLLINGGKMVANQQ